jgi:hypothetical protein
LNLLKAKELSILKKLQFKILQKALMIEKSQKFQKHKFIKIPNLIFSKQISKSKLKKEIFNLQKLLKLSNSFIKKSLPKH